MLKAISVISVLLILTSCSAKFACKDSVNIKGEKCNPITTVYENKMLGKDVVPPKKEDVVSTAEKTKGSPSEDVDTVRSLSLEDEKPIRLPPRVIRIWIAPWEDADGDLNQTSYIYSEISPKRGRWLFGEKELITTQPILRPLERPSEDLRKGGSEKKETPGKREDEKKEREDSKKGDSRIKKEPFRHNVQPDLKPSK